MQNTAVNLENLSERKKQERDFHDFVRSDALINDKERYLYYTSNAKFYKINRRQESDVHRWWSQNIPGKDVLDYCCGVGAFAVAMAAYKPKKLLGIDISENSIKRSANLAREKGFSPFCEFQLNDAENLSLPDNSFDVLHERGALHHLHLEKAYAEMARVLRPAGAAICQEALVHNPIIHLYRKLTPHLRTAWEVKHILGKKQIELAKNYFHQVDILGFYHLATLLAVPFRTTKIFNPVLTFLEKIDNVLLNIPGIKWLSWCAVFILSKPKK